MSTQIVPVIVTFLWLPLYLTFPPCSCEKDNSCDPDSFYRPYVMIKRQKNGATIASLRSTGFLDLRVHTRILLCINGPAVLYKSVEVMSPIQNDTVQDSTVQNDTESHHSKHGSYEELRFRDGELNVYNHECMSINKLPNYTISFSKRNADKGHTNSEHSGSNTGQFYIHGVYLIGRKESYMLRELVWFKAPNFDYVKSKDKTVKASSFIVINSKSPMLHECVKLADGTGVKVTSPSMPKESSASHVCRWSPGKREHSWYSRIFQSGFDSNGVKTGGPTRKESDFVFSECPDAEVDRDIILTMGKTTPKPVKHSPNFTEFDPFSLFNPNAWTPHGFRSESGGLSGGDERPDDKQFKDPKESSLEEIKCSLDDPDCLEVTEETSTVQDMQNVDPALNSVYLIRTGDCMNFPKFHLDSCTCKGENAARLLEVVMDLEPNEPEPHTGSTEETAEATDSTGGQLIPDDIKVSIPNWGNLESNVHLRWKHDVLYTVAEIYENLCMPFRREFPYQVARAFGWYVLRAHAYGEHMGRKMTGCETSYEKTANPQFDHLITQPDIWIILHKELQRCSEVARIENGGRGFKFRWEVGDDSGKWKVPTSSKRKKRSVVSNCNHGAQGKATRRKRSVNKTKSRRVDAITGKPLSIINSEGNSGYARETIQEFREKPNLNDPRQNTEIYFCDAPENLQHCVNPQEDPSTGEILCSKTDDIFFYEDKAEVEYDLNIAIDLWWKIWATTIGYCNKAYSSRKSETFPILYNGMYEYFFELVMKEWKQSQDNGDLKNIFSEYLTEESRVWLDACVEAGFINSNSQSYRPPRPMTTVEGRKVVSNFFDELPSYLYSKQKSETDKSVD